MVSRIFMQWSLVFLWLYSGVQPIVTATDASLQLLAQIGIAAAWQWPLLLAASLCDVVLAVWTAWRPSRVLWWIQCGLVAFYSVVIAVLLPENWLHPFGPLVKNVPLLAMLVYLASSETRKV